MHFFQLVAAWLFPCAVCAAAVTAEGAAEHESSSSSSSLPASFGAVGGFKVGAAADRGSSSPSDASTASPSSPSSSVLGARSSSSNSARSPDKQVAATEAAKGDAVRRCMRRLARKLQRTEGGDREQPPRRRRKTKSGRSTKPPLANRVWGDAVDGTAREREEAVAGAIAYCKQQTAQCKCKDRTSPSRRRDASPDDLLGRQRDAAAAGNSSVTQRSGESSVPAAAETGRTSRRGPAGAGQCLLGTRGSSSSSFNELELDALRITSYFTAKYMQCNLE